MNSKRHCSHRYLSPSHREPYRAPAYSKLKRPKQYLKNNPLKRCKPKLLRKPRSSSLSICYSANSSRTIKISYCCLRNAMILSMRIAWPMSSWRRPKLTSMIIYSLTLLSCWKLVTISASRMRRGRRIKKKSSKNGKRWKCKKSVIWLLWVKWCLSGQSQLLRVKSGRKGWKSIVRRLGAALESTQTAERKSCQLMTHSWGFSLQWSALRLYKLKKKTTKVNTCRKYTINSAGKKKIASSASL